MGIRRDHLYFFLKSGNEVRAIAPTTNGGRGHWVVERTAGASAGKQMVVPGRALLKTLD